MVFLWCALSFYTTHRYVNEPREALKEFNFARKDSRWGAQAIMHMVEVGWLALPCMPTISHQQPIAPHPFSSIHAENH